MFNRRLLTFEKLPVQEAKAYAKKPRSRKGKRPLFNRSPPATTSRPSKRQRGDERQAGGPPSPATSGNIHEYSTKDKSTQYCTVKAINQCQTVRTNMYAASTTTGGGGGGGGIEGP